jgi:hypothetical protein
MRMVRWSLFDVFKRRDSTWMPLRMPNALSGYFELRVDRIVGWVQDAYGSDVTHMQIEVLRGGRLIASVAATAQPEQRRFVFSLPVEGRFNGVELVREEVTVVARDCDGNGGHVLLDGATQLELLREHLGVPAVVVFDLDFSYGGNAKPYLGDGWSGTEVDITWTEGDDSFISFDTPVEPGTYALRMTAGSLIYKPDLPARKLLMFINATQVACFVSTESHAQFHECKFPHEAFTCAPRTTLRLHHPDAVRPSDLGESADNRLLAFCFKRLTLVRLVLPGLVSKVNPTLGLDQRDGSDREAGGGGPS